MSIQEQIAEAERVIAEAREMRDDLAKQYCEKNNEIDGKIALMFAEDIKRCEEQLSQLYRQAR